jgi:protein-L-isoaspartate(D-aspartate) O-methyltransferase
MGILNEGAVRPILRDGGSPSMDSPSKDEFAKLRREMVERAIAARGVRSEPVLAAMRSVPREAFLPRQLREFAYEDSPLPIEEGQTISQPYIVAFMTEALALEGGEKVLEIGTGSGYAAAVLAEIADDVYTVERIGQLAEKAASALADLGYANVHVLHGDGTRGWPDHAPYDGIIVAAGGPKVPDALKEQLKIGGRLVIPRSKNTRARSRHANFEKRIPHRRPGRCPIRAAHWPRGMGSFRSNSSANAAAQKSSRRNASTSGRR